MTRVGSQRHRKKKKKIYIYIYIYIYVLQSFFFEFCVQIVGPGIFKILLTRYASEALEPANNTFLDISFPRVEYNVDVFLCAVKQTLF